MVAAARPAQAGHQTARPIPFGKTLKLHSPLLLAPMAGITSAPFRLMCAEFGADVCTSEMIIASTLLDRVPASLELARWAPEERVRSAQLYATRPSQMRDAAKMLREEHGVDHIDLNFGCPVRKVTARGGGAAVPLKLGLFRDLVAAAVAGAEDVHVTVKMRLGVSPALATYMDAGCIAQDCGAAALTLHTRYAEQLYAPPSHWQHIAALRAAVDVPIIGNGDILQGCDALRMRADTGADGFMVGRACLGRPWVFAEVNAALHGKPPPAPVTLHEALLALRQHAASLAEWTSNEQSAVLQMRKFVPLYLLGFASAASLRGRLFHAATLEEVEAAVRIPDWDPSELADEASARAARLKGGRAGETKKVALPHQWLDDTWGYADFDISDAACEG